MNHLEFLKKKICTIETLRYPLGRGRFGPFFKSFTLAFAVHATTRTREAAALRGNPRDRDGECQNNVGETIA